MLAVKAPWVQALASTGQVHVPSQNMTGGLFPRLIMAGRVPPYGRPTPLEPHASMLPALHGGLKAGSEPMVLGYFPDGVLSTVSRAMVGVLPCLDRQVLATY